MTPVTREYFEKNGFSIYDGDCGENGKYTKYFYHKASVYKVIDDETLYMDDGICVYKYINFGDDTTFEYDVKIYRACPGFMSERIDVDHKLGVNVELTVEEIESLRNTFNI